MKDTSRFYARLFALTALPFGASMLLVYGLIAAIDDDLSTGYTIISSAASALLYGAVMTLLLGRNHVRAVQALAGSATDESLNPRQTRVMHVDLPQHRAFELCVEAIRKIPHAKIVVADSNTGTIEARASATMKSWGEIITVRVQSGPSGSASVEISSRPSFKPTVVDYGTNLEHVLAIERALNQPAPALTV